LPLLSGAESGETGANANVPQSLGALGLLLTASAAMDNANDSDARVLSHLPPLGEATDAEAMNDGDATAPPPLFPPLPQLPSSETQAVVPADSPSASGSLSTTVSTAASISEDQSYTSPVLAPDQPWFSSSYALDADTLPPLQPASSGASVYAEQPSSMPTSAIAGSISQSQSQSQSQAQRPAATLALPLEAYQVPDDDEDYGGWPGQTINFSSASYTADSAAELGYSPSGRMLPLRFSPGDSASIDSDVSRSSSPSPTLSPLPVTSTSMDDAEGGGKGDQSG
jgi:hypothetical protein